jgi:AraC-like DNA-binding protein
MKSWIRWQRVRRALVALHAAPSPRTAHVAFDAGFSDQSHMVRTFSDMFDYTPSEIMRAIPK